MLVSRTSRSLLLNKLALIDSFSTFSLLHLSSQYMIAIAVTWASALLTPTSTNANFPVSNPSISTNCRQKWLKELSINRHLLSVGLVLFHFKRWKRWDNINSLVLGGSLSLVPPVVMVTFHQSYQRHNQSNLSGYERTVKFYRFIKQQRPRFLLRKKKSIFQSHNDNDGNKPR